jgi:hypothetical protein
MGVAKSFYVRGAGVSKSGFENYHHQAANDYEPTHHHPEHGAILFAFFSFKSVPRLARFFAGAFFGFLPNKVVVTSERFVGI